MPRRLLLLARSILAGWIFLLLIAYALEHPLLHLLARKVDASWFPTVRLMLDCSALAATGWLIGRLGSPNRTLAVAVFAATLIPWDLGDLIEIRVPWLLQLAGDALRAPGYRDSLLDTAIVQIFLFGSLAAGARLTRRRSAKPLSIVEPASK